MFGMFWLAALSSGSNSLQFDLFVDSVGGNDANDGTSADQALASLTAAAALVAAGNAISLSGDFADELDLDDTSDITVQSSSLSLIDGSDPAGAWTQPDVGGAPNVWSQAWVSTLNNGNYAIQVWEDDAILTPRTTRALCNANAGSSFVPSAPDGNDPVEIHATGGGDPNSNGKTYRITRRRSGIHTNTAGVSGLTVRGVHFRRPGWLSGSLVTFTDLLAEACVFEDGVDHGILFASGNVTDCAFVGSSPLRNSGTSNMLVTFTSVAGSYEARVRRTGFLAGAHPAPGPYEDVAGIFSHNDQVGVTNTLLRAEQCWFVDLSTAGEFRGATIEYDGCFLQRSGPLTASPSISATFSRLLSRDENASLGGWTGSHTWEHCVQFDGPTWRSGSFTLSHCAAVDSMSTGLMQPSGGGINNITMNFCIHVVTTWGMVVDLAANTGYAGDHNVFASYFSGRQMRTRSNNVENMTLAAWQAATGQDTNSCYILPADQTAGNTNALWLAYAQAAGGADLTLVGPQAGDFRINPTAKVYSGANVAFIGTFPDGTPITQAGPQTHWDWATRASVSGPPQAWPTVPETLADSLTYAQDPQAWDFYP